MFPLLISVFSTDFYVHYRVRIPSLFRSSFHIASNFFWYCELIPWSAKVFIDLVLISGVRWDEGIRSDLHCNCSGACYSSRGKFTWNSASLKNFCSYDDFCS